MDAHFDAKRFPVAAVDYLENEDVQGPLLSPDYWGGYLIYRLYPRVRMVVLDDRHDFYGEEFLKSYLKMVHVEPGWEDFLSSTRLSCVLATEGFCLGQHSGRNPRLAVDLQRRCGGVLCALGCPSVARSSRMTAIGSLQNSSH